MRGSRRHRLAKVAAALAVFAAGVAVSLAVATPSARSGPEDCVLTVVCTDTLPTTLPSLPTTITTVTETLTTVTETLTTITQTLPTGPQTTTGSTTTNGGSQGGGSGSSGQGSVTTTAPAPTGTVERPSPVAGGARVAVRRFRATVRRVGKRRWLTISFDASVRASGHVRLTIPRQKPFSKSFVARSGRNARRFALPARAGKGRRQLLVTLRSSGGSARVRAVIRLPG